MVMITVREVVGDDSRHCDNYSDDDDDDNSTVRCFFIVVIVFSGCANSW